MSKKMFRKVSALFQSKSKTVLISNVLAKAYADGTGNPDWYKEFDEKKPQEVAMSIAGLYAADSAANMIARIQGPVNVKRYEAALKKIVEGKLTEVELYLAKNCANLSWRAGQPFRDIDSDPLGRIERDVNMQYNLLPEDEEEKDLIQVVRGAEILLQCIDD